MGDRAFPLLATEAAAAAVPAWLAKPRRLWGETRCGGSGEAAGWGGLLSGVGASGGAIGGAIGISRLILLLSPTTLQSSSASSLSLSVSDSEEWPSRL